MPDSLISNPIITIVVPVKDEDIETIKEMIDETRTRFGSSVDILIVDDGSRISMDMANIRHSISQGYGAALKSGIRIAKSEWICTADGDGQHRLRDVERLIEFTKDFPEVDMVIGDRRLREPTLVRHIGRKTLNWLCSLFALRWIPDLNSGLRLFRRSIAIGYESILCDKFSFTTSITLSFLADGYKVDWLPIKVLPRFKGKSKVCVFRDGLITLKYILWIGCALRTRRLREWIRPLTRSLLGRE